jgi:hypothetical protein
MRSWLKPEKFTSSCKLLLQTDSYPDSFGRGTSISQVSCKIDQSSYDHQSTTMKTPSRPWNSHSHLIQAFVAPLIGYIFSLTFVVKEA